MGDHLPRFAVLVALLCMAASSAVAAERVLIPTVISGELPGAYGSIWTTELMIRNESDETINARESAGWCRVATCPISGAPRSTFEFEHHPEAQGVGAWLYYDAPNDGTVIFNLRVQDVSRQSQTWGTRLPVVREEEFSAGEVHLINIPTDPRFRQALRLFDLHDFGGNQVRLRIFPNDGNTVLVDTVMTFSVPASTIGEAPPYVASLFLANDFPVLRDHARVRLLLSPITPGLRYWAFVTIGNNETQHVTTVVPDQISY